jgi:hypothetical protein
LGLFRAHFQPTIAGPMGNSLQLAKIHGPPKFNNRFVASGAVFCINASQPGLDHRRWL